MLGRVIRPPRREPARPGRLRLVEQAVAADDVSAEGDEVVVPLDTGTLVLGSHPSCDVVMRGLRPRHAVLGRDADGALVLRAISGTTYVDGSPVLAQRVDAGSEIRLAGRRLRLQVREPALV